jgi:hypothetical protein
MAHRSGIVSHLMPPVANYSCWLYGFGEYCEEHHICMELLISHYIGSFSTGRTGRNIYSKEPIW